MFFAKKYFREGEASVKSQGSRLVSGNSHENSGPVVMEMASARTKIRHVFGFTCLTIEVNKTGTLTAIVKPYDWLKPICPKRIFTPPGNRKGACSR